MQCSTQPPQLLGNRAVPFQAHTRVSQQPPAQPTSTLPQMHQLRTGLQCMACTRVHGPFRSSVQVWRNQLGPHIVEMCLSRHLARDRSGWNRGHIPVSFLALPPCAPMVRFFLFLRMYPTVGLSYGCLARPQVLISCASECDIKRLREHPRIFRDCQPPSGVVRPHLLGIPNGTSTLRLGFSA